MGKAVIRWAYVLVALLALGPGVGMLMGSLRAPDGGLDATLLTSTHPVRMVVMALAGMLLAGAFGVLGVRLLGVEAGLTGAGLVIAWLSWRVGLPERVVVSSGAGAPGPWTLEAAIVGGMGVVLAYLVVCAGGARGMDAWGAGVDRHSDTRKGVLLGVLGGVVGGAAAAWLVAVESTRGQALLGCVVGGIGAGAGAQLGAGGARVRPGVLVGIVGLVLVGLVGPLLGSVVGSGGVLSRSLAGQMFALGRPNALQWVSGAMLGVPIGMSWASSMLEKPGRGVARAT